MIITISNEYGAGALAVARRAAAVLGYRLVDHQLPVVVAKRLRVAPEVVEAREEATPTLGQRLLSSLERATPELAEASAAQPLDENLLAAVQKAVRDYAAKGNCVIVGRGAATILGARPDVLRVFLHAPPQWRLAHVVETTRAQAEIAQAEVERMDRARIAHMRDWYGVTFGDVRNYDLCIDSSRIGAEQSADLIAAAVRAAPSA